VRDGITLACRGIPVVTLVTDDFSAQGSFVARAAGMPEVPRVLLPHPVAGTGRKAMMDVARSIAPTVLETLRGDHKGEIPRTVSAAAATA